MVEIDATPVPEPGIGKIFFAFFWNTWPIPSIEAFNQSPISYLKP
jgi:hypothetical protein